MSTCRHDDMTFREVIFRVYSAKKKWSSGTVVRRWQQALCQLRVSAGLGVYISRELHAMPATAAASAALAVCFRKTKHIIRTCFITISFGMSTVLAADDCVVARSRIGKPQPFSGHFDGSLHLTREISYLSTSFKASVEVTDRTRRYVSENYEGLADFGCQSSGRSISAAVLKGTVFWLPDWLLFQPIWQVSFASAQHEIKSAFY